MSGKSKIEWTNATWNPITGCSVVSPGCTNCYAMRLAGGRLRNSEKYRGLTNPSKAGPVWSGVVRVFKGKTLMEPLRWRKPHRIFVCSMSDLFHDAVPDDAIDRVFAIMALAPQHTFQVLTKRPERMMEYMTEDGIGRVGYVESLAKRMLRERSGKDDPVLIGKTLRWPLPNVWVGTSVEDQKRADERIPHLLNTPAAVRFLSCEPLLGPIDLTNIRPDGDAHGWSAIWKGNAIGRPWIDWVIVGGESGSRARAMHPDWAHSIRDQCQNASVPFFFKQWGEWAHTRLPESGGNFVSPWPPGTEEMILWHDGRGADMARVGKKVAGRTLDGRTWDEYPNG